MTDQPAASEVPSAVSGPAAEETKSKVVWFFILAMFYLACLITVFIIYACSPTFRQAIPTNLGQLPVGVVWFGATGAVVASMRGIFFQNERWDGSYNYWHISRPFLGAITGSVGALLYLVSLHLGSSSPITVNHATFYAVAFVLGFADRAFMELLGSVTDMIIKPGQKTPTASPPTAPESLPPT